MWFKRFIYKQWKNMRTKTIFGLRYLRAYFQGHSKVFIRPNIQAKSSVAYTPSPPHSSLSYSIHHTR